MNFTKTVNADLEFPRRELSNGCLGIVVALSVFPAIDFLSAHSIGCPIQLYAIERYGWELSTLQRWDSNAQCWQSYAGLIF